MITTLNSNLRTYMVVGDYGHAVFCNLPELNQVVREMKYRKGYFKIYDFWNNKPKKVSGKSLKDHFAGICLTQEFDY